MAGKVVKPRTSSSPHTEQAVDVAVRELRQVPPNHSRLPSALQSLVSVKPSAVFVERVTKGGEKILEETQLRDDGNKPDTIAGDGFYSGTLDLGIQNEGDGDLFPASQ